MKLNFNISEFNITRRSIPERIADKILHYHILPMQIVREILDVPIVPSSRSGYRPPEWERMRGRNGKSQHTFIGKGAVDWTCKDFRKYRERLVDLIIQHTEYTRIAVYDTFIHCDYKKVQGDKRQLYSSNSSSRWKFVRNV